MFKTLLAVILVVISVLAYGIYSARALPEWFDESAANGEYVDQAINKQLGRGGNLLAQKSLDILRGRVAFNEEEFNALMLASLKSDPDGQRLLKVSDGIRAFLRNGEVEVSAVINLEKLGELEPDVKKAMEKFDRFFWVIEDGRVAVTVFGTPVVRRGGIGVKDTFYVKVGEMELSNETLRSLKVPVEQANQAELSIQYLSLKSVNVKPNQIEFGVRARF